MRRGLAGVAIGLAGFAIALVPVTAAGAAGDPAVTISASCGGPAFCFTPPTLTITDGDTVTWTNSSGTDHFVGRCDPASCDGASGGTGTGATFGSSTISDGSTFSHTFHGAGTYTYFCAIHGYAAMHGMIVVNAAPSTTAATTTTAAPSTTAQSATPASIPGSTPESVAATTPASSAPDPQLAHTGHNTRGTLAVGIAALVLGLAAWGGCTPRRGVVSRLRR